MHPEIPVGLARTVAFAPPGGVAVVATRSAPNPRRIGSQRALTGQPQVDPFSSSTPMPVLHKYRRKVPALKTWGEKPGSNIDQPTVRLVPRWRESEC